MPFSDAVPENPAVPRDAATVVLLRDTDQGLEVFLQRRVAAMAFAAGMTVFPGGGVDERDADASVGWTGPEPARWAEWFSATESGARALVCAAVRETFEESGVLLAGSGNGVVGDARLYAEARQALVSRELSLAAFLAGAGLTLRADLLRPWAHWITPVQEKRRYDTRFFAAVLPAGQHADGATTEADASGWQRPADALTDAEAGRSVLMPPTWHTLTELAEFGSAAEALAAERTVEAIIPTLIREEDRIRVVCHE
ncbi:MAG TPA: NUDIX hydrolase [Amycolatopsis sp.]|uniref:NUDIX hydrolase n=1 Tax=Amycolatopsis sp. TaxID=37632 RepID=UPI002B499358|nr:NUDIX hydrolase [Amycolatopsis sp.]HKS45364.1 NUDIX hydrolase [Amycolatopsis sp.]